jgi:type VI protein secretion system component Hcp
MGAWGRWKSRGVYLQYTLTNVFVSSYQVGGHGDTKAIETVSLSNGSLAISYTRQH